MVTLIINYERSSIIIGLTFEEIANWASIISLAISLISLYLIGTIRYNVIGFRRKVRIRKIIDEIRRIPDDAMPLSNATKSKFKSLSRNLPKGWLRLFSKKNKAVWDIQKAIKSDEISSVKEGIEDWISYSEDL